MKRQCNKCLGYGWVSNPDEDEIVELIDLNETPGVGEAVNINGIPYVVHSKLWAFHVDCTKNYCYIRLIN